jgi:hypothetical protein
MNPLISIIDLANSIDLTDHHCHGVEKTNLERADFEIIATESDWPEPNGMTIFVYQNTARQMTISKGVMSLAKRN